MTQRKIVEQKAATDFALIICLLRNKFNPSLHVLLPVRLKALN